LEEIRQIKRGISLTQNSWESFPGDALAMQLAMNAPLTRAYLRALLKARRQSFHRGIKPSLASPLEQETGYLDTEWRSLSAQVQSLRPAIFQVLDRLLKLDAQLDMTWLSNVLARPWLEQAIISVSAEQETQDLPGFEENTPVPESTLRGWRKRGLIVYDREGRLEKRCLPPLLLALLLDRRQNKFMYSYSVKSDLDNEVWCIVQKAPTLSDTPEPPSAAYGSRLLPWPSSRLQEVPASTIVIFEWAGAVWDQPLLRWNSRGAIGFVGAERLRSDQVRWQIGLQDMRAWDANIADLYVPLPGSDDDVLQWLANVILARRAYTQFTLDPYGIFSLTEIRHSENSS